MKADGAEDAGAGAVLAEPPNTEPEAGALPPNTEDCGAAPPNMDEAEVAGAVEAGWEVEGVEVFTPPKGELEAGAPPNTEAAGAAEVGGGVPNTEPAVLFGAAPPNTLELPELPPKTEAAPVEEPPNMDPEAVVVVEAEDVADTGALALAATGLGMVF